MKILQVNSFHYRRGGADVVFLNTIDLLRSKGNTVFSFSMKHFKNEYYEDDTSVFLIKNFNFRNFSFTKKLRNVFSFIFNN